MNNNLMIFENPEFGELRSLRMNGEPWFVGRTLRWRWAMARSL